jgi:hypothetical protein
MVNGAPLDQPHDFPPGKLEAGRQLISKRRRSSVSPQLDILRRRREDLLHRSPEAAESERLRKEIDTLEREVHHNKSHEELPALEKTKSKGGVKFFSRPKLRAYFDGERLFKSRGDNEYAATSSISLFTDLLFVGVLAETGKLVVSTSNSINVLVFLTQFLPSWRIWCYIRDFVSMYEMNAASQRFVILWILWLLVGFTVK